MPLLSFSRKMYFHVEGLEELTLGPSKLENVADPGSGPRGPLPKIGVHYLNLNGAILLGKLI